MIINIRGTSGSGKSTLVRNIVKLYTGPKLAYHEEGRKQPLGYMHHRSLLSTTGGGRPLGIVGHYETDCGGCDTIPKMERIFELVRAAADKGMDVIFEGLLISADVERTATLAAGYMGGFHVIALDVPIEECLDSVNARRRGKDQRRWEAASLLAMEKGKHPEQLVERPGVNPKNTISKHKGVKQSCKRLRERGIPVHEVGRVAAYGLVKELLGL
jgi:hypothetical protein